MQLTLVLSKFSLAFIADFKFRLCFCTWREVLDEVSSHQVTSQRCGS